MVCILWRAERGGEGGSRGQHRLQAGEESEDVVAGGEAEMWMLDPVNTDKHQLSTARLARLLTTNKVRTSQVY